MSLNGEFLTFFIILYAKKIASENIKKKCDLPIRMLVKTYLLELKQSDIKLRYKLKLKNGYYYNIHA